MAKLKLPKKDYRKGDLPDTAEGWVEYINGVHDSGLQIRNRYEQQWVLNLAYYKGYQHLRFNSREGHIEIPREFSSPLTINRIGAFIEARHAKLTKNRPITRVMPNSNDPEDIYGAKNSDRALVHLWRAIGMEAKYDLLTMQMLICGTAFMEDLWDPRSGDYVMEYKTAPGTDDVLDIDQEGEMQEKVFMGEVATTPLSAFSIIPGDDSIPGVAKQPWIIKRGTMPISDIEDLYPDLRGEVQHENRDTALTNYERILQRLASPSFHATGRMDDDHRDAINTHALVKTFMMRPNYQYERGIVGVVIGDKLAQIGTFPNEYGDNVYPLVRFVEKENGFSFWGQSTLERQIPIQRAYNRISKHIDQNAATMAKGKWLLPKGSQVHEEAITDEEAEIIEFNSSVGEPKQAALAPLPNYVINHREQLITDFRDAGGQREASVTPTPGITAGVAMQVQAELSDEIIGPILKRMGFSMEVVANQQLLLMDQEYIEPRRIKIFGEGNEVSVMWMSNVDFRHHTDVHVEIESMYPDFRGAKRQMVFDLWDRRIIQDPKKIMQTLRYGNWDFLLEEDDKVEETIELGLQGIKKGKAPEISPLDNHMLWVQKLTDFSQTPEFMRLIPERKQLVLQVWQAHLSFLMQQIPGMGQPMAQTNQNAVGTPFGPQLPAGAAGNQGTQQ